MKSEGNKRVRDPETKRRHVIEAATRLFAEKGFDGTSVRDIASEAEENMGTIYYYFDDKLDLFYSVLREQVLGSLGKVLVEEANKKGTSSERLKRLLRAYVEIVEEQPEYSMMTIRGLLRLVNEQETPLQDIFVDRMAAVERIIQDGQEAGELAKVDGPLFSRLFLNLYLLYFLSNLAAKNYDFVKKVSPNDFVEFFDQVILTGIEIS